jgi:hypothetical protein
MEQQNWIRWGLCPVIGATRSVYTLVSEPRPLLPQNNVFVLRRPPNRGNIDQPSALSLCSAGGCYLGACACFLGSLWRGDQWLSYELLWACRG